MRNRTSHTFRDPLRRLPTPARLWAAAGLAVLPLGFVWSFAVTPGITLYGDCGYSEGPYCTPDTYLPGSGHVTMVSQAPIRFFLVAAAVAFAACAVGVRTAAKRSVARVGCLCVVAATALAAANGSSRTVLCLLGALALVAPLVVPRGRARPVLAKRPNAR